MNSIPLPNYPYTRTYRFTMEHLAKLSHLSGRLRKDQSEIVRNAIDEYYERYADVDEVMDEPSEQESAQQ